MNTGGKLNVIGAGPTGALLAIFLQRRGFGVTLYESRPDPRGAGGESGRSINLALADRGIHALRRAGAFDAVARLMMPMRGRFIHPRIGAGSLQRYGRREQEVIYSISRHRLNQVLLDLAIQGAGIDVRFEHRLESVELAKGTAWIRDQVRGTSLPVPLEPLIAADGAGSMMRHSLCAAGLLHVEESELEHGYKELTIPASAAARAYLADDALHIWPRGDFMLIALPNADGSFTATLFLAKRGSVSFAALHTPDAIANFLDAHFPDLRALMPDDVAEFQTNPTGFLGTVHAQPWAARGTLLMGDAAHAIVPFHGQGMNCCFEDCVVFDQCLSTGAGWREICADFFARRKADTDAIAAMALENYGEMRERVVDAKFQLQQALALELERRHPTRFIPRYAMVTFHHEIPYRTALERGRLQAALLAGLTAEASSVAQVDFERAAREIELNLAPLPAAPG